VFCLVTVLLAGCPLQDKNTLLAWAVNPDMRVAFDHWRGEAQGRDSSGESSSARGRCDEGQPTEQAVGLHMHTRSARGCPQSLSALGYSSLTTEDSASLSCNCATIADVVPKKQFVLLVCLLFGAAAKFEVEGVDMLLFNDDGQISTLVQFDMQVRGGGVPPCRHTHCACVHRWRT
jgi:hypothetical protein